mgnify:FL=1
MTNEKLAELIQEGDNDELLPLLWDKTRLLIYQKCGRLWQFYSEKLEWFGYSFDDLQQEGYNALIFAVKGYKSEKGYKFATYLTYALKRVIRDMLSSGSDVLNQQRTQSLEQPLVDNSEGDTLLVGDVVPDERAAAVYEDIDRLDEYNVLYEAIDSLPDVERSVIIEHYFKGFTFAKISRLHGFTRSRAEQTHKRAIWLLRRGKTGRKLFDLYGSGCKCSFDGSILVAKHTSLHSFNRSHTSEVEDYVIWLLSKGG